MRKKDKPSGDTNATRQYENRLAEVDAGIERLRSNLKKHATRQRKRPEDWGFSGDLGYVLEQLRIINSFMR